MADYNSGGKESKFNEAALKVQRIHDNQNMINIVRTNPLIFYKEFGKYGYDLMATAMLSILKECFGKMSPKEKKKFFLWRKLITISLESTPVYSVITHNSMSGKISKKILNKNNWNEIREYLFQLEDFTNEVEERTEYGGASKENPLNAAAVS